MMYIVIVAHKIREALSDCIPELVKAFPNEPFTIEGSEEKGYQLRLNGSGDEKAPRVMAEKFLKTRKPKPPEENQDGKEAPSP